MVQGMETITDPCHKPKVQGQEKTTESKSQAKRSGSGEFSRMVRQAEVRFQERAESEGIPR